MSTEDQKDRALRNIAMAAWRGLAFGHGATPQPLEAVLERRAQMLRVIAAYCAETGHAVGGLLRDRDDRLVEMMRDAAVVTLGPCRELLSAGAEAVEQLQKELRHHREEDGSSPLEDCPSTQAIEDLWQGIIVRRHGSRYGPWEYPGQAYRHILAEFRELEAEVERLKGGKNGPAAAAPAST